MPSSLPILYGELHSSCTYCTLICNLLIPYSSAIFDSYIKRHEYLVSDNKFIDA